MVVGGGGGSSVIGEPDLEVTGEEPCFSVLEGRSLTSLEGLRFIPGPVGAIGALLTPFELAPLGGPESLRCALGAFAGLG